MNTEEDISKIDEMNLSEIKELLDILAKKGQFPDKLIYILGKDNRVGCQRLLKTYLKQKRSLDLKLEKLEDMIEFDRNFQIQVAGIDEAGRGPLAGPVVAAAVVLDFENLDWALGINDSKQLKREERQFFYDLILEKAKYVGVGMADVALIDEINIRNATHKAMEEAVSNIVGISAKDLYLLVDGLEVPILGERHCPIVQGDAKSLSIAAASIVAKEKRDSLMEELDRFYPGYGFSKHKGYGTKEHIRALAKLGPSPVHRRSFLTNFSFKQGSLF